MKRLIRIAAAVVLAGSLVGGPALADDHGHGHGRGHERGHDRGGGWARGEGDWGRGEGGSARGGRWDREPAERDERDERDERGGGRWGYAPPPEAYGHDPGPVYPRRAPPPGYGLRRGGLVPPEYRGAVVPDYGRHRLRPPPPGFAWVRIGDRYMLVSRATGQIFDVIGD